MYFLVQIFLSVLFCLDEKVSAAYLVLEIMLALMRKITELTSKKWQMKKLAENKTRMKLLYALATIAMTMFAMSVVPAFATHVSSKSSPPWNTLENVPVGCSADGKQCAHVHSDGTGHTYAKANGPGAETKQAITRHNQNHAQNQVGVLPQVSVSSLTSLSFDVVVTASGKLSNVGQPNNAYFRYGGDTWKLVSGTWQKQNWFHNIKLCSSSQGCYSQDVSVAETVRYTTTVSGDWRLGSKLDSLATRDSTGEAISNFGDWNFFTYYGKVSQLLICHAASSTTPCP